MSGPLSSTIQFDVDILATSRDVNGDAAGTNTNSITAQLGDVVSQQATDQNAAWVQHVGFCSRPSEAVAGRAAAQGVVLTGSSQSYCVGSRDLRGQQLYANLQPGESCIYGGGADGAGQGRVVCKADGSVTLYTTTTNTQAGQGIYLKISPTEFRFESPFGRFWFDMTGFHVRDRSGARIDMGSTGMPAPLDSVSSMVTIGAAAIQLKGSCLLGPGPYVQCATGAIAGPLGLTCFGSATVCTSL